MVCPKCGLPDELCVCETIAKEQQKIKIYIETKRYRKSMTVIEGMDSNTIDVESLLKKMKTKLACGGTYKDKKIELQGNHKDKAKKILENEGFPAEMIDVE